MKKKCLFVNIHLPPVFPWRFVVITVREEHRMWLIQLVCFKLVTPLVRTVEFLTRLGDCSVTLELICEARPVWRSKFAKFAPSLLDHKLVYQLLHPPEILLSHSRACNGSFCFEKLNTIPVVPMDKTSIAKWGNGRVNMDSVFDSLLLGSKQQNFQLAYCPCQSAWAINLPM